MMENIERFLNFLSKRTGIELNMVYLKEKLCERMGIYDSLYKENVEDFEDEFFEFEDNEFLYDEEEYDYGKNQKVIPELLDIIKNIGLEQFAEIIEEYNDYMNKLCLQERRKKDKVLLEEGLINQNEYEELNMENTQREK